jgi:hypothetical protein
MKKGITGPEHSKNIWKVAYYWLRYGEFFFFFQNLLFFRKIQGDLRSQSLPVLV